MALSLEALESEIKTWFEKAADDGKAALQSSLTWITGEKAKAAAAIALLTQHGYTVAPPPVTTSVTTTTSNPAITTVA